jgi:phenylpropionate dioxygenase-like ring-hydroxylating dioxygenase large terminal subunit
LVYKKTDESVLEKFMLRDRWYPILETAVLGKKSIGIKRFGLDLVLWRDLEGVARLLPATCPHRGASLAGGRVIEGQIECPWHGFRFDGGGQCRLLPCEGPEARITKALDLPVHPIREEHDLIWMWWGEERTNYPEVPFYQDIEAQPGFTEASRVLPYHYSRMIETNLDIHHTPFVHGNIIPVGTRVVDFEAHLEGDRIYSSGVLAKEKNIARSTGRSDRKGMPFRADLILPNLGFIALTQKLHILVCATPVDDDHSWVWFRYRQSYTGNRMLGKLITWISVHSELRVVQKQDWRLFATMTPGTIDDFPYAFVHSDKAIALYRSLRAENLKANRESANQPTLFRRSSGARSASAN